MQVDWERIPMRAMGVGKWIGRDEADGDNGWEDGSD